jgi:hypothetical protein
LSSQIFLRARPSLLLFHPITASVTVKGVPYFIVRQSEFVEQVGVANTHLARACATVAQVNCFKGFPRREMGDTDRVQ